MGEPTAEEIRSLTRDLRDISSRLARWEPVDPEEIEAFHRRVAAVTGTSAPEHCKVADRIIEAVR